MKYYAFELSSISRWEKYLSLKFLKAIENMGFAEIEGIEGRNIYVKTYYLNFMLDAEPTINKSRMKRLIKTAINIFKSLHTVTLYEKIECHPIPICNRKLKFLWRQPPHISIENGRLFVGFRCGVMPMGNVKFTECDCEKKSNYNHFTLTNKKFNATLRLPYGNLVFWGAD